MEKTSRRRVVKYILVMRSEDILVCICYLLHHAFDLMSDLHLISPTISPSNHSFKVMRMKEMIPNFKGS